MRKGTKKNNVTLREKALSNGNISLYLDIYRDGVRVKEYLKLYIVDKPKNTFERQQNKETLQLAEEIRTARETELNHSAFGLVSPVKKRINFLEFFQNYVDTYTKKDLRMMQGSLQRFKNFLAESYPTMKNYIKPEQMDKDMMVKFVEYLQNRSIGEGARGYFQRFKKVVKYATEKDIFHKNPTNGVSCIVDDTALTKDVLTLEEIQELAKTPYQNGDIKKAFLFCLYAGLRYCDVVDLKYSNVDYSGKRIKFEQAKTKGHSKNSIVIIPLSQTLFSLIGEKPTKDDYIFKLPSHTGCLKALRTWVARAGIDKHITWHCARHSFAVNLLGECQTDIKTVASLLGHSGLKHTEKYTRAVDSLKEKAVNSLPEISLE
ncbi:site-specific integrase [Dysgonomonas sp. 37-18]|uniref:site-specific integrase n=1 Tax=unclassified Dysgonomonas TaxID=2630389 RepID=UPI00092946F0|nr:site-specific integrase [Dysgonomonas sp. 37-18]OJX59756.1 MAG: integrase [Dysgonomonas sp. 37-18]